MPPDERVVFLHAQEAPPGLPVGADPGSTLQSRHHLFLNFDGAELRRCGYNDPATNCTTRWEDTYLPYTGEFALRASIAQAVRADVAPFNMEVTDVRPEGIPYDMEMIGDFSTITFPEGVGGIAPDGYDCDNVRGPDISFTFETFGSLHERPIPLGIVTGAVLQELAHSWGLEHVESQEDLLFPVASSTQDRSFVDECVQITTSPVETGEAQEPTRARCPEMHARHCSEADHQNSFRDMLYLFGEGTPDLSAPEVVIEAPVAGSEVEATFDITVLLADNQTPQIFDLSMYMDDELVTSGRYVDRMLTFRASGVPTGEHVVRFEVEDEQTNVGTAESAFTVVGPSGESGGGDGDSEGDEESGGGMGSTGGDGDDSGGTGEEGESAGADDPDPADGKAGCACGAGGRTETLGLLGFALCLIPGRRRGTPGPGAVKEFRSPARSTVATRRTR